MAITPLKVPLTLAEGIWEGDSPKERKVSEVPNLERFAITLKNCNLKR